LTKPYLNVNALTIDAGQEGLDLRALPENNRWILYLGIKKGGVEQDMAREGAARRRLPLTASEGIHSRSPIFVFALKGRGDIFFLLAHSRAHSS